MITATINFRSEDIAQHITSEMEKKWVEYGILIEFIEVHSSLVFNAQGLFMSNICTFTIRNVLKRNRNYKEIAY